MPSISRITSTFFVDLINRLGVRPPPHEGFELSSLVQPVTLVDSDIALVAEVVPPEQGTPYTVGIQSGPGPGIILADTGPLQSKIWNCVFWIGTNGAVTGGGGISIQRRNAANSADIWSQVLRVNDSAGWFVIPARIRLDLDERIRITVATTFTAGLGVQASIWVI